MKFVTVAKKQRRRPTNKHYVMNICCNLPWFEVNMPQVRAGVMGVASNLISLRFVRFLRSGSFFSLEGGVSVKKVPLFFRGERGRSFPICDPFFKSPVARDFQNPPRQWQMPINWI